METFGTLLFSLPYTILSDTNKVLLLCGEDFRYTLEGDSLDAWLPALLRKMDGETSVEQIQQSLLPKDLPLFHSILHRLLGERVLVRQARAKQNAEQAYGIQVVGHGMLQTAVKQAIPKGVLGAPTIFFFCQDSLDYQEALLWNQQALSQKVPFFWVSLGPMSRAYVSPLFLPESGPCFACLLSLFKRRSPFPKLYDLLIRHTQQGEVIAPSFVSDVERNMVVQVALAKFEQACQKDPAASLYQLHVVEFLSLEVSTHDVVLDPFCDACLGRR